MKFQLPRLLETTYDVCLARGHRMRDYNFNGTLYYTLCIGCGREATVNPRPGANEIAFGGEAVAFNCDNLPREGMGATIEHVSDCYAGTILEVKQQRGAVLVIVQYDKASRTDRNGQSEMQTYQFQRDPQGRKREFMLYLKADGSREWCALEHGRKSKGGPYLKVGEREHYLDPSL